uniref:Uncharacterized protein n=1 Tax=Stegastes partitus TaxID=144197 RepID=A0A3B5A9M1_9TELE
MATFSICIVPDFAGFPPSTAVNASLIMACFSLSKAFCRVILSPLCEAREKCSF